MEKESAGEALYGEVIRRYQNTMVRLSSQAAESGTPLPERFSVAFRRWTVSGAVATILPLIALYFMVVKPAI